MRSGFSRSRIGCALRHKFGVGKDVETDAILPAVQDSFHRKAVFTGRVLFSMTILEDSENSRIWRACLFPVLEIGGHPGAEAEGLGRRVHADENDIIFPDSRVRYPC